MIWKIVAFLIGSAVLIYISRSSLHDPRSHGFPRFFAWEVMLVLVLLNMQKWLVNPLAWYQIVSWLLLLTCIIPVVWGTLLLTQRGKPVEKRVGDPSLLAFEKTTTLVTNGIYKYIRHPLYSSLLLLTWGIFFKFPSWLGALLAFAASVCLYFTARADEAECTRFFGAIYPDYMKKTRRFIPYVF